MHALCLTDNSAIAANYHPNQLGQIQRASRTMELVIKETISICTTPDDAHFNQDNGYELPDGLIATFQKLKNGASMSMQCPPTRDN